MRIYYLIWVDCIRKARQANPTMWKVITMAMMTMAMCFNFLLILTIIEQAIIGHSLYRLDLGPPEGKAKDVLEFVIQFSAPWLILNYFLIFRGGRYEKLISKYPYHNGQLFMKYFLISVFVPVALLWIGIFFSK
jgi:hypothetical protein